MEIYSLDKKNSQLLITMTITLIIIVNIEVLTIGLVIPLGEKLHKQLHRPSDCKLSHFRYQDLNFVNTSNTRVE